MHTITKTIATSMLLAAACVETHAAEPDSTIVTEEMVGAAAMPARMTPVTEAPFSMDSLSRPVFPAKSMTLSPDCVSANGLITPAINDMIAELSASGGGTIVVPRGKWRSGRITLKSNVNLRVERNAELIFSGEIEDYVPAVFTRHEGVEVMGAGAFIYANGETNIALTGKGVISGPDMGALMRKLPNGNSVVENDIDYNLPVEERICDGMNGNIFYRPKSFAPVNCKNVLVEGVTFERSVLWNVNPIYCENVIIRGITVNSTDVPSGDGIDISSCRNVLVEYSTLNCGDDCFTLKAGRCEDGVRVNRPTENVVIRYCLAKEGHGGITCGSETAGWINNVYLHHCVFNGTRTGIRFKTRRNRGGGISGIVCDNIRMTGVREAFTWDLLGSATYMGELARRYPPLDITPLTPTVRDIRISNFIVESSERMMSVHGIPEIPCAEVTLEKGTVDTGVIFKAMEDINGLTLRDITINATDNNMTIDNAGNIVFDGVTLNVPGKALNLDIKGGQTSKITLLNNGAAKELKQGLNEL